MILRAVVNEPNCCHSEASVVTPGTLAPGEVDTEVTMDLFCARCGRRVLMFSASAGATWAVATKIR